MVLKTRGYQVSFENSPVRALGLAMLGFDLAILDYDMPELNGVQLVSAMRARGARYPVLLLSGRLWDLETKERSLFSRCLFKGTPTVQLLQTVKDLLYGIVEDTVLEG